MIEGEGLGGFARRYRNNVGVVRQFRAGPIIFLEPAGNAVSAGIASNGGAVRRLVPAAPAPKPAGKGRPER